MIQRKICMVGAFATGKTSLVARFVYSIFSEKYQTTVGVKIDKKIVNLPENPVNLIIWDIYGEDELQKLQMSYMRGCSGYLLVVDGTRKNTLETAYRLQNSLEANFGRIPFVLVMNKWDITDEWEVDPAEINSLINKGWNVVETSAKTGIGVEEVFQILAQKIMET
ncbi:Small GTP-binding protein domain protein [Trichormus variabilis ATCC 29413]|uniref:Small GTP-binding protein domain protein n=2 Tax=Anabaena variabilis TaxID=264691 RepID=Q3MET1_TRIV2|nr:MULTISPECIES: Rab family GTPase [Nostocaceae]ABA20505.1 Small GTP-binding protein domain protein [Trichormus variabilis ATCC 29413]MBC1214678.1 GTP-binding protein [Trichormus variabilis ARAD]MBC1257678.1 GTP-binding protein [Trichormus variabilis V5]MBC1267004.1 GTP-binding protein [Trichormus variabilis FSR]MBC1300850.1 GTP-binding protein [Trichormus variabilis N2B]